MGSLACAHELVWKMRLSERGHSVWWLVDSNGRRWGWVINVRGVSWTAHVGSFGQASLPVTVDESVRSFTTLAEGRDWVEAEVADAWAAADQDGDAAGENATGLPSVPAGDGGPGIEPGDWRARMAADGEVDEDVYIAGLIVDNDHLRWQLQRAERRCAEAVARAADAVWS